jgi:hypothetical protein
LSALAKDGPAPCRHADRAVETSPSGYSEDRINAVFTDAETSVPGTALLWPGLISGIASKTFIAVAKLSSNFISLLPQCARDPFIKVRLTFGLEVDLPAALQKRLNLLQAQLFSCSHADQQSPACLPSRSGSFCVGKNSV